MLFSITGKRLISRQGFLQIMGLKELRISQSDTTHEAITVSEISDRKNRKPIMYPSKDIPKTVAHESIKKQTYWYKHCLLFNLGNKYNIAIEIDNRSTLLAKRDEILKLIVNDFWGEMYHRVKNTGRNSLYGDLTMTYHSLMKSTIKTRDIHGLDDKGERGAFGTEL